MEKQKTLLIAFQTTYFQFNFFSFLMYTRQNIPVMSYRSFTLFLKC